MQSIQQLPNIRIFTNDIPAIYFLAGRDSSFIPTRINPAVDESRSDYLERLREMHWDINNEDAILVILGPGASSKLDPGYMNDLTEGLCLCGLSRWYVLQAVRWSFIRLMLFLPGHTHKKIDLFRCVFPFRDQPRSTTNISSYLEWPPHKPTK